MSRFAEGPWFWVPIGATLLIAAVFVLASYLYNRGKYPRNLHISNFDGPVRSLGIGGGAVGLIAPLAGLLLSEGIRNSGHSASLAVALGTLSLVAMVTSLWLYSAIQNKRISGKEEYKLRSNIWLATKSFIYVVLLGCLGTSITFLFTLEIPDSPARNAASENSVKTIQSEPKGTPQGVESNGG